MDLEKRIKKLSKEKEGILKQKLKVEEQKQRLKEEACKLYIQNGLNHHNKREFLEAVENYSKAIQFNKEYAEVFFIRGRAYYDLKQYDLAIQDSSKAIEIKADYPLAYCQRGNALLALHKDNEAISDFTRTIEFNDKNFLAFNNRGNAYFNIGKYTNSLKDYEKAIEINPTYYAAYCNRGNIYRITKNYPKALEDCGEAIKINDRDPIAFKNRGHVHYDMEKFWEAIEDCSKAILLNEKYSDALVLRGIARIEIGEYSKSIEDSSKALHLNPTKNGAFTYMNVGTAFHKLKNYDKAIENYILCMKANSKYTVIGCCNIAKLCFEKKKDNVGDKWFIEALKHADPIQKIFVFFRRYQVVSNLVEYDSSKIVDDLCKFKLLSSGPTGIGEIERDFGITRITHVSSDFLEEEITKYSEKVKDEFKDEISPKHEDLVFEKISENTYHIEEMEYCYLKERISVVSFSDLSILRVLGSGSFGCAYQCLIRGIPGIFVVKLLYPQNAKGKNFLIESELSGFPYHHNCAMILSQRSHTNLDQVVDVKKLPNFDCEWKSRLNGKKPADLDLNLKMIIMRYYQLDLRKVMASRSEKPFSSHELLAILRSLLEGLYHLHKNFLVHRDIHPGNIFIHPRFGRLWIGDFGLMLDVEKNSRYTENKFIVHKDDVAGFCKSNWMYSFKGGDYSMPPEVLNFEKEKEDYVNFSKYDVYSAGIVMKELIDNCSTLGDSEIDTSIKKFVCQLHEENVNKRVGFEKSVKKVKNLAEKYFKEDDEMNEYPEPKIGQCMDGETYLRY